MALLINLFRDIIRKIEDELLLFSAATLLLVIFFNEYRYWIFALYLIAVIGFVIYKIFEQKRPDNKYIERFEQLLTTSSWRREIIDATEIFICETDNNYQVEIGNSTSSFTEPWTQVYSASHNSTRASVYLRVNANRIREMTFVYCDSARIFVPLPKTRTENGNRIFYWSRNSLDYKLGKVVGDFYIYESMEGIARMSNIRIEG